ncbi:armadillo-type protein [Phascolomyces articulosus]|uniref:Armadillo-type protein n=1 Tax=Phascolomyces articulosus TaxID=60185 RepID=A0AAD5JXU4_9FUNG|nr:armadillo-type protein [Phascolomyces articulosus]
MSQPGMSYLDQVLDPALPSSLSFLRNAHTKATTTSTAAYHHTDIPTTSSMDNSRPPLPMRRARAGTMPSLVHMPEERAHRSPLLRPSPAVAAAAAAVDTRHRSGSLNLPVPPPMNLSFDNSVFGSSWSSMDRENGNGNHHHHQQGQQQSHSSLPSPSTEQLLRGDSDFSIARTLRSLGLEDDRTMGSENGNGVATSTATTNGLYHQQEQSQASDLHVPAQRSLLSGSRSRSYSVNAAVRYQEPSVTATATASSATSSPSIHVAAATRTRASTISRTFANPLENLTVQQNRPRASSMGRMDYGRSANPPPVPSSLWQMQRAPLETLTDESSDFPYGDSLKTPQQQQAENALSLGDSELLANMLQKQTYPDTLTSTGDHHQDSSAFVNGNGPAEPYLHFSQSTPTFRNHQVQMTPSTSTPTQAATRSLWIGNIDATVSVDNLTHLFSSFGHIESVRLLLEKECAFVNFFHVEDAIRAKEEVLGRLGGRVGNCIVRIGFGRADAAVPDNTTHQPTRALWLGNIPPGTAPSTLLHIFQSFGIIESVRVLSHKNCGFVNFELVDSAAKARDALLQNEIGVQGFTGVRVGFAKVPPAKSNSADGVANNAGGTKLQTSNDRATVSDEDSWLADLWEVMKHLGSDESSIHLVKGLEAPSNYFDSIPPVPELGANRKFDASRLREIRKKLDNATHGAKEVEAIAYDCLDEIAELSSDYIGNTVVQRLFEKCTEETKTAMLEHIAPHLAAIGIHKNGTWAAQKIIDTIKSPDQVRLVCLHLKPYVPPLLLDQFGNYAVQCCLRLGDGNNQFIFDAMVEKLLNVAQGRFGARAMRGTLENQHVTLSQQKFVAASLVQNAMSLAMNANGALLLSWLIDSSNLENRYSMLANRLVPQLVQIATHKLGSQMLLKLFNQNHDIQAREAILAGLTDEKTLEEILADQVRGVSLIQKILSSSFISTEERDHLSDQIRPLLNNPQGAGHKKLLDELLALDGNENHHINNDDDDDESTHSTNSNNNSNNDNNDDDDHIDNDNNNQSTMNGDDQ